MPAVTASMLVVFLGGLGQALSNPVPRKPTVSKPSGESVRSLTVNWRANQYGGRDSFSADLGSFGRLTATCNPDRQTLTLVPGRNGVRTVVAVDSFAGTDAQHDVYASSKSSDSIDIPLPPNGMLNAVFSQQPVAGDGGSGPAPVTLTLSSEYVVNDEGNNFCFVAGQTVWAFK